MTTAVYSYGLVAMSVCSDDPPDQIEAIANRISPTGISSRWQLAPDPYFATGGPNPGPCERNPDRTHYLLIC